MESRTRGPATGGRRISQLRGTKTVPPLRSAFRPVPVLGGPLKALAGFAGVFLAVLAAPPTAAGQGTSGAGRENGALFESRIRPILSARCFPCHGAKAQRSFLRLDSRDALLRGGAGGPAIVPSNPDASRLLQAIRQSGALKMPPGGRLREGEIAAFAQWIRMGAPWPAYERVGEAGISGPPSGAPGPVNRAAGSLHWSFQTVRRPPVPLIRNTPWVRNPIDAFILAGLEARGLAPAPRADRRALIRRAYFDLIGLPPTAEQTRAFCADRSPDAWERVIDGLLASPHYGERWGRHWLDTVRYADSNGLDENKAFANAYRYRDYVISALNRDKPYDQFIQEQIAGDLMPAADEPERNERLIATGFLILGAKVLAEQDKPKLVMDIVDEQIEVTSKAILGLTVACARCHDHKFDPISTRDYYALAGIFKSTRTMADLGFVSNWNERPLDAVATQESRSRLEQRVQELETRNRGEKDDAARKGREEELKSARESLARFPVAMAADEGRVEDCPVHIRGDTQRLGDRVPRGFPTVLAAAGQPPLPPDHSGRFELAQWLTRSDNPLTARVAVNRLWQGHFGEGLVRTPENFGFLGEKPTHPKLLDWLAAELVAGGGTGTADRAGRPHGEGGPAGPDSMPGPPWSLKRMHRLIMMSSTYQAVCGSDPKAVRLDPENRLWSRRNRRRLEAEALRDSILAVSGRLDRTMGGSLLTTRNNEYVTNDQSANAATYSSPRRSIYLPVIRNALYDMFQAFDFGDPTMVNARRATTTVAPQALFLMNSSFVADQARAWADRLLALPVGDEVARVRRAYLDALSRSPSPRELARAAAFLTEYRRSSRVSGEEARRSRAWQALCQALLASNEFAYVD